MREKTEIHKLEKARTAARGWVTRASNNLSVIVGDPESADYEKLKDMVEQFDKHIDK